MIRVFLAGEGASELGSRSGHPVYQSDGAPGVLQSLLRAVRTEGWEVAGAIDWRHIRKLRANAPGEGDGRSVLAAALHAVEQGASVLAFTRDRDRDEGREEAIERAVEEAERDRAIAVVGGVAIETIEGWLIALTGEARSESIRHPEKEMPRLSLGQKHAADYAAHVRKHGLGRVSPDARSLLRWIDRARRAFESSSAAPPT